MNLEILKKELIDYLNELNLVLYELTYSKSDETLTVLLDNKLSMEELEKVSNDISNFMDKFENEFPDNYILDVSTVGVERDIRNEDELIKAVGSYIYVKTADKEYYGDLKSYVDNNLELECKDKTRIIKVVVAYKDVKKVRYAVKF